MKIYRSFYLIAVVAIYHFCTPATSFASFHPGHNLSITTDTLFKSEASVGNYAVAYGLSNDLTIATSPWLYFSYAMPMALLRWRIYENRSLSVAIEASYFKTSEASHYFHQESSFWKGSMGFLVSPSWVVYLNVGHQHFTNDQQPFSLRPDAFSKEVNPDKNVNSISLLNDFSIANGFGAFLEVGRLGVNYLIPYSHIGASIYYSSIDWSFQFGSSVSFRDREGTPENIFHPEIQIQRSF